MYTAGVESNTPTKKEQTTTRAVCVEVFTRGEDICTCGLRASSTPLRAICELLCAKRKWSRIEHTNEKKNRQPQGLSVLFWSKCGDSNSRPPVPETGALPTALHLEIIVLLLILLYHSAYLSARPRWRLLLKHSRTAREVKPLSHYSLFLRIRYSLLLGHVRGLTVHRTVIQYPHAASLRRKQHSVVFVCSQLCYTSKLIFFFGFENLHRFFTNLFLAKI